MCRLCHRLGHDLNHFIVHKGIDFRNIEFSESSTAEYGGGMFGERCDNIFKWKMFL